MIQFVFAGLFAGVCSGLFGIGGGIILVPIMVFIFGMSQHSATGTALVAMLLPVGIMGVINYYQSGKINGENIKFGMLMALGIFIGAFFGSKLGLILPEKTLKMIFGVFLVGVGLKFIF